jgi:Omp85 superfamily domain
MLRLRSARAALRLVFMLAALSPPACWPDSAAIASGEESKLQPSVVPLPAPNLGWSRWFNPTTAPFIPVPEIGVDPDSGTTLGVIPTWVHTDANHDIRRIIAPDVLHNPNFGYGGHFRIYDYPSEDRQWSLIAGVQQRVQRGVDGEYQVGRLRTDRWSVSVSLVYDRNGAPRFYGIGNATSKSDETNYTNEQERVQVQIGRNLSRVWQLLYTARVRAVDVLPGTLPRIASIESRYGGILGIGSNHDVLNRLSIIYDTRDELTVPTRGASWVVYGGLASHGGVIADSSYSEAGIDGRNYFNISRNTILVSHVALRYLPNAERVPFWALSSIGGGESEIGGEQPLRGFGARRYADRNSFSTSLELRRTVASFDAVSTHVDVEVTPFVDLGRVFARASTFPLTQLHGVGGVGFRGIARPFVVGFVDIGYGSEGVAAFTGINYPF